MSTDLFVFSALMVGVLAYHLQGAPRLHGMDEILFRALDKNQDGLLDATEIRPGLIAYMEAFDGRADAPPKDDQLSQAEIRDFMSRVTRTLESGPEAADRLRFQMERQQLSAQLVESLDTNKDGKLDRNELPAEVIRAAEEDGDGTLDATELKRTGLLWFLLDMTNLRVPRSMGGSGH
eukprot:TRINITY_DN13980_c0_g1_i1.p1 TRINITY_DN13980_c0_g1~~TRINITY_DN13980_c0_g1_i1.p1  ORF type:complete len:178 (+),score=54.72 TRINITY_DN13980_c0_g1_i1:187-720(+)